MTTPGANGDYEDPEDLLDVLQIVAELRMPSASWITAEEILTRIEARLFTADGRIPVALVAELETVTDDWRLGKAGCTPTEPAPRPVRERLDRTTHQISNDQNKRSDPGAE